MYIPVYSSANNQLHVCTNDSLHMLVGIKHMHTGSFLQQEHMDRGSFLTETMHTDSTVDSSNGKPSLELNSYNHSSKQKYIGHPDDKKQFYDRQR